MPRRFQDSGVGRLLERPPSIACSSVILHRPWRSAGTSPAVSVARHANRRCGVNPLRGSLASLGDTAAPPGEGATTTAGDVHRVDLWRALGQHNEQRRRGREGSNRSCLSIPGHVSLNDGQDKW